MDIEESLANAGGEPVSLEEAKQEAPQEELNQEQQEENSLPSEERSLDNEKPTEEENPSPSQEPETPSSEQDDSVFEVETDEDLAKFVSDHYGKEISPDRLKSILEEPKEVESSYANDTIKELNDYVANGGDIKDFMEFKMTDYSQMSDLDKVTKKMQRDYPQLSSAEIKRKLDRQFKLDDTRYDEDDIADGQLDLKIAAKEADDYFNQLKEQYASPLQTKVESQQESKSEPDFSPEELKAFQDNMTSSINNLKTIEIAGVKHEVNDDLRNKIASSPADIGDLFVDGDKFDFDRYNQFKAIAIDPEGFVKTIKAQAENDALKSLKDKRNNSQLEAEQHNPDNLVDNKKAAAAALRQQIGGGNNYTI